MPSTLHTSVTIMDMQVMPLHAGQPHPERKINMPHMRNSMQKEWKEVIFISYFFISPLILTALCMQAAEYLNNYAWNIVFHH